MLIFSSCCLSILKRGRNEDQQLFQTVLGRLTRKYKISIGDALNQIDFPPPNSGSDLIFREVDALIKVCLEVIVWKA